MTPTAVAETQITELREMIALCRARGSREGYFAALYTHVSAAVAHALERGEFAQPESLCLLNDRFFARYREAFLARDAGDHTTGAWRAAFAAADRFGPCVVQHLLLGMNAHINLDLPIALAKAIPADELSAFLPDFNHMNCLLRSALNTVLDDLAKMRPALGAVNRCFRVEEGVIINFSMCHAREHAWRGAVELSCQAGERRDHTIQKLDDRATAIAGMLARPAWPGNLIAAAIRAFEPVSTAQILDDLTCGP